MNLRLVSLSVLLLGFAASISFAQEYVIDPVHTSFYFSIEHAGINKVYGRFDDVQGKFTYDQNDPAQSTFQATVNTESVDTSVKKRDDHLRSPDFFDVKQFPTAIFQSTSVKKVDDGLEVTGDFTLHGVTKPLTVKLTGFKTTEFPPGTSRMGLMTQFKIKRSDFGMNKMLGVVGDEVELMLGIEGTRK